LATSPRIRFAPPLGRTRRSDRARLVSALIETLLAYEEDQTVRARLIAGELRQVTGQG